jgi:hypothetical protein
LDTINIYYYLWWFGMDEPREETMRRLAAERATTAAPKNKG